MTPDVLLLTADPEARAVLAAECALWSLADAAWVAAVAADPADYRKAQRAPSSL